MNFHITNTLHRVILQVRIQITPDLLPGSTYCLLWCDLSWVLWWWSSDYCLSRLCWTALHSAMMGSSLMSRVVFTIHEPGIWTTAAGTGVNTTATSTSYRCWKLDERKITLYPVYMYVHLWSSLIHFMAPKFCQYLPIFHSCLFIEVKAVCSWCSSLEEPALITL